MALDRIKELLELMEQHELGELELKDQEFSIRLVKGRPPAAPPPAAAMVSAGAHMPAHLHGQQRTGAFQAGSSDAGREVPEGLKEITSPIVGTFYRSPAPDVDPFVEDGAAVDADTTICIIEAMKVMNEVKAEMNGTIRKVLVENGQAVEYGQPIFLIEPAQG
jgi:acetyl-CoA carboxylase biotin carboxyl carrier protein